MVNTQCYLIKAFSNIKDTLLKVFHTQSIKIQLFLKQHLTHVVEVVLSDFFYYCADSVRHSHPKKVI